MKKSTLQTIIIVLFVLAISCISCSKKMFDPNEYANQRNKCGKY